MDTSDPSITFDRDGHCNHCTEYLRRAAAAPKRPERDDPALAALVERIRRDGAGSAYDCVVGLSGGADSSYAALTAARLGLRVLGVHMDNGWNSAVAVRNIKRVVDGLGIDYVSVVLDWEEFKDLQLAFFKASVPEIETPTDIAIPAALHEVAEAHGVRYIVSGGNLSTEGILPRAWHYDAKDLRYLRSIHRRFGTRPLRTFPTFDYRREAYYKLVRHIQLVYLLQHVPYRADEAAAQLRDELGWQPPGGKHHESVITRFVQSYVLPVKFGYDYRRATFSTLICAGELDRAEALERLRRPPYDEALLGREKSFVARKLGIAVDELDRIVAAPPKSFADYPNNQRFLERLYAVYRVLFSPATA